MPFGNIRKWRVIVRAEDIGWVFAGSENEARAAALSKFGIDEEEAEEGTLRAGIYPCDDFEVQPE